MLLEEEKADEELNDVPEEYRERARPLVEEYHPTGVEKMPVKLRVVVKDEVPVFSREFRLSPKEQKEMDDQLGNWLKRGIIRPSHSENASPPRIGLTRSYIFRRH